MAIPGVLLDMMRDAPQASDVCMIIQQPQYYTEGPYLANREWLGHVWSCRVAAVPADDDDPVAQISVNNGAAAVDLEDGMTIFIGSSLGEWDRAILRVRTDQTVGPATNILYVDTTSELRGRIFVGDYIAVLDEFRLRQRYGRVTVSGTTVTWYKDHNILWDDLGADDDERRAASQPPCPVMGSHAVGFVDPPEVNSQFYFDWSRSYATAPSEVITDWVSSGEQDFAGNSWNSVLETPGWQQFLGISGMRGFRITLRVWDGNGTAITAPYRRGHRYVFTMRRPGQSQPGDPPYAEPITAFRLESLSGSFERGYWTARVTVYGEEASKYTIIPGSLVILFTDDYYTVDSPYMSPTGVRNTSIGQQYNRENILMVGYVGNSTISVDPDTGDTSFEIASAPQLGTWLEAYPIPIEDKDDADDWIYAKYLSVDRAAWHYVCWHSTLAQITDYVWYGDNNYHIKGMDFTDGAFYPKLNTFYRDRLFARPLCDKSGRIIVEIDAQMRAFGDVETLWTLDNGDWVDSIAVTKYEVGRCKAAECGGIYYLSGNVTPYLSRAPGAFNAQYGVLRPSNNLATQDQDELNILSGRYFNAENREWMLRVALAGNWSYLDIVPQAAVLLDGLDVQRESLSGRGLIREVTVTHYPEAGCLFTSIELDQEMPSDPAGVTVPILDELPYNPHPPIGRKPRLPVAPGIPGLVEIDEGRRIFSTNVGVFVTDNIGATYPIFYPSNSGLTSSDDLYATDIKRDPFHWWTSGGTERTLWAITYTGVWKQENFPTGIWVNQISLAEIGAATGHGAPAAGQIINYGRIAMSIETDGKYAIICHGTKAWFGGLDEGWAIVCQDDGIVNATRLDFTGDGMGYGNIAFAQHSGANTLYAASNNAPTHPVGSRATLKKTVNGGGAWVALETLGIADKGAMVSISIPYIDAGSSDQDVLWGRGGLIAGNSGQYRVSTNAGASFADIPSSANQYSKMGTGNSPLNIWLLADRPDLRACKWTNNGGVSYTNLPLAPSMLECMSSHVVWKSNTLQLALTSGVPTGGDPGDQRVYLWKWGQAAWSDKTGNLESFGVTLVTNIERDSMGSA